jgi:hypothetical protein
MLVGLHADTFFGFGEFTEVSVIVFVLEGVSELSTNSKKNFSPPLHSLSSAT